jgi:hypothetical protein
MSNLIMEENIVIGLHHHTRNHMTSAFGLLELHAENEFPDIGKRMARIQNDYVIGLQSMIDQELPDHSEVTMAHVRELKAYATRIPWTDYGKLRGLYDRFEEITSL